jgi:hypothetical protein
MHMRTAYRKPLRLADGAPRHLLVLQHRYIRDRHLALSFVRIQPKSQAAHTWLLGVDRHEYLSGRRERRDGMQKSERAEARMVVRISGGFAEQMRC